jgi:hypothetical protein
VIAKPAGADEARAPAEMDPAYLEALECMQQGLWDEAAAALDKIDQQYRDAPGVRLLRQRLALHLSAEDTWANDAASRLPRFLRPRVVRVLLVANLIVYLLLAIGWLVGLWSGLLR